MLPIGVFDSGVGGLTVLRALKAAMPAECFVYLGDTARLPYGSKSPATIVRYSLQCAQALSAHRIRCLVVACNTASAFALPALRERYPDMPIFGVVEPGAAAAVQASRSGYIAVVATQATIDGGAYERAIRSLAPEARIATQACALFVALAEEGWNEGEIAERVVHRYLDPLFSRPEAADTLVLGCTHYPLLLPAIRACLPAGVRIIDSAATTAQSVREVLRPLQRAGAPGAVRWLATDGAARFARVGSRFFGEPIDAEQIQIINL